ncbi:MAG: AAA family ATPase, partial [Selenomonadaceae bacterium]|nr:AAA family ATPase [Selenomonadaceae bacterium]
EECREKLWQMYIPAQLPNNLDAAELAKKFEGISGSDISNAMLNAAFKAARQGANELDESLVFEAVENILESKKANLGN